jgi:glycerate 2-kinase
MSRLSKDALAIARSALAAADPVEAVRRHVTVRDESLVVGRTRYPLSRFERIFVIGAGKASAAMAVAVESLL